MPLSKESQLVLERTDASDMASLSAEVERLREPFKNIDEQDWDYILSLLPDGGRGRYWQCVLLGIRNALKP